MTGYPFLDYINEDKSHYKHAKDAGYNDPYDLFLIGESGGFLLNIIPGAKFINTDYFCEMANEYRKHNNYTASRVDSFQHRHLRKREEYRRKNGFDAPCLMMPNGEIRNVHITGNHYNFLNYTQMERLDTSTVKQGNVNTGSKKFDFPRFIDSQFWTFHCIEFAKNNGFNILIDKTRRGGFSYMMAASSANAVNNEPHKTVIHVANKSDYLTDAKGLTDFTTTNLKFYEEKTMFKRGLLSTKAEDFRLGYRLPNNTEAVNSWHSSLLSVSAFHNPNCAIGKDAVEIKVEEVSTMDNFDEFMGVTEPTLRTGAYTTGFLAAWGTATAGNMQVFERNFYNPNAFNFMPFENVWDKDSRNEVCGYFKPYCWGLEGEIKDDSGHTWYGLDSDGNSYINIGLQIAKGEREKKKASAKSYSDYINYIGQYANFPAESFSSTSENLFSSEELNAWEEKLKFDTSLHFGVDGQFEDLPNGEVKFVSNKILSKEGKKVYDWIYGVPRRQNEDAHGCVRIWFFPEYSEKYDLNGNIKKEIPKGTYTITYDPVGIDKDRTELTDKYSHNSIKVWMNPCILNGYKQKLCAAYYGRPDRLEEADRILYQLAKFYNCIGTVAVEINRGETVSNFRKWGALKYLACEPLFVWDTSMEGKYSKEYGYNMGNTQHKLDGLRLLKEFLYEEIGKDENGNPVRNFHRIYDYQSILELKKWNVKGNFDRVSEMILRGIYWKSLNLTAENQLTHRIELNAENIDENDILNREWY